MVAALITDLFTAALGLQVPWQVSDVRFDPAAGRIDFDLSYALKRAPCPVCDAADQPIHDRLARSWRHLNFFQYQAYLHAPVPRIACAGCGKTTQMQVPWANPKSGFTLLFEAFALGLARHMPMAQVARLLGVNANPVWDRFVDVVQAAYGREDFSNVRSICVDETAAKRGHDYLTVVADSAARKVLFVTQGKDAMTLSDFANELPEHGAKPDQIQHVSMDFSAAFIKGAREQFPNAQVSFDPFHLIQMANKALDDVRRSEVASAPELRGQRFSLLKDQDKLRVKQKAFVESLASSQLKTARAWRMKEALRDLVRDKPNQTETVTRLSEIKNWLQRSRLGPMVQLGRTIHKHQDGIVRAIADQRSNGFAESLNSLIQAAKARARGFRSITNFICMIYFIAGKLQHLPNCPWSANNRIVKAL